MVADVYETILLELSEVFKIPPLKPDPNHSCLIKLKNGCEIQIEPDAAMENLIIGANIAAVPPGGYRANIFREALKFNGLPPPKKGIFAWSKKADQLVLFSILPLKNLTGTKVAELIVPFTAIAMKWREAILAGHVPQVEVVTSGGKAPRGGGLFGL